LPWVFFVRLEKYATCAHTHKEEEKREHKPTKREEAVGEPTMHAKTQAKRMNNGNKKNTQLAVPAAKKRRRLTYYFFANVGFISTTISRTTSQIKKNKNESFQLV